MYLSVLNLYLFVWVHIYMDEFCLESLCWFDNPAFCCTSYVAWKAQRFCLETFCFSLFCCVMIISVFLPLLSAISRRVIWRWKDFCIAYGMLESLSVSWSSGNWLREWRQSEYCVYGGCLTVAFGASHGRRIYSLGAIFWSKADSGLSSSNRLTSLDALSLYDCLIISYNFFGNFVLLEVCLNSVNGGPSYH